jgi:hypothetical protein
VTADVIVAQQFRRALGVGHAALKGVHPSTVTFVREARSAVPFSISGQGSSLDLRSTPPHA